MVSHVVFARLALFVLSIIFVSFLQQCHSISSGVQYDLEIYPPRMVENSFRGPVDGIQRFENVTRVECAAICTSFAQSRACRSFSFATNPAELRQGNCDIIYGSKWSNYSWPADQLISRKFYIDSTVPLIQSIFTIILPINGGPTTSNEVWKTDCMNQGGIGGIVVAIRNNLATSAYLTHVKCRVFQKGVSLVRFPGVPWFHYQFAGWDMTCSNGSVITAIYDYEPNLPNSNAVRCNLLNPPWIVDTMNCRNITVYKQDPATLPLSPMNDPTLSGTADSVWGAQCGTPTTLEAMIAYKLSPVNLVSVERITCCALVQLT